MSVERLPTGRHGALCMSQTRSRLCRMPCRAIRNPLLCMRCRSLESAYLRMQSELLPSAWPVEDPSKDQSGNSLGSMLVMGF